MLTVQPIPQMAGERQRRGLGWVVGSPEAGGFVNHSGSNRSGFRCYCRFHPKRGTGLVIMTNGVAGGRVWQAVVELVDATSTSSSSIGAL